MTNMSFGCFPRLRNQQFHPFRKPYPADMLPNVQDELVPFTHMEELNKLIVTPNKTWIECPNSGHMDAYETDRILYWTAVKKFWEDHVV